MFPSCDSLMAAPGLATGATASAQPLLLSPLRPYNPSRTLLYGNPRFAGGGGRSSFPVRSEKTVRTMSAKSASRSYSKPGGSDAFVLLDENRFAYTAVQQLQKPTFVTRSPWVYVYGPSGCGKSHLAQRFVRELRTSQPNLRYNNVAASDFAAQLAEASENKRIAELTDQYVLLEAFVCEDVQALAGRTETQRLLLTILDQISVAGGRILLTADRSPGALENIHPRLISRFQGGIAARMDFPAETGRVKLFQHFADARQIPLAASEARLLARELAVSPREIMAAVVQLEALARLQHTNVDEKFIRHYLKQEVHRPAVTMTQIVRAVAQEFGVRVSDIRSRTRLQNLVVPRQCAMYLARQLTGARFRTIAEFFGKRNHSTVVHACQRLEQSLPDEPALRQHVQQIACKLSPQDQHLGP